MRPGKARRCSNSHRPRESGDWEGGEGGSLVVKVVGRGLRSAPSTQRTVAKSLFRSRHSLHELHKARKSNFTRLLPELWI